MPPKTASTIEQLYARFTAEVEDFDNLRDCLDTLGKPPERETLRQMGDLNEAIRKLARDMKRTKSDFASEYPDVGAERDRIFVSLVKLRKAKESEVYTATDGNKKEEEIDSTVSGLVTEFNMWKKYLNSVGEKIMKNFEDNPTPSSFEVDDMKRFLEKLQTAEKTAWPIYIKLDVQVSKYSDEQKRKIKINEAKNAMKTLRSKISFLTRRGQEYSSKFTPSIPGPDQVSTFSTWPLRSCFRKHNVPGFKKEYDPKYAPNISKLVVVNNPIKKEEKPEVTTKGKNDVKEVKSVDTNVPAIGHFFDDKNQRPRSQVLDDGEQGDDIEETDHYDVPMVRGDRYEAHTGKADHHDVPTARATDHHEAHTGEAVHHDVPKARADDHYEAHTGKADHYEDTLEGTDQTEETKEVYDDEDEEEALVAASQEREQVSVEVAPQVKEEKGARVHSSLCFVASQERKAVDVASQEREEKQEVDTDTDVDATGLSKTMKVSNDEESHLDEDIQTKTDESFDETIQTNDDQANKVSANDENQKQEVQLKSDELFENYDHSKENDEVNGDNKHDQVKIEELFESIAIFLFFPNYKYRKKRWPGKLDL